MIKTVQLTIAALLISANIFAQIGIGTTSPDASSALDVVATNKGFLMPRMTTAQRTAISNPATGLQVFDTDFGSFWYYNGAIWSEASGGKFTDGASTDIAYYSGRVGIGINNFSQAHKLYVQGVKTGNNETNTAVLVNAEYQGTQTSTATYGVASTAKNSGTGTVNYAIGLRGTIDNANASGNILSAVASYPEINNDGNMDYAAGMYTTLNNYGTMSSVQGIGSYMFNDTGKSMDFATSGYLGVYNSGTIDEVYGLYLGYDGPGTVNYSYAIYIGSGFNQGATDNFAIYSDAAADSYLNGNLGIGTNAPQQKVHISGAMRLEPQASAPPNGALGDLYAGTDGNLYFHDGTGWKQVQLN
ncbi:MAG: hypothetical protein KDC69_05385 [Flavobacteriaceae bacterium]|nr:hypothetical protein [Flavobacteriaceae bacterium]